MTTPREATATDIAVSMREIVKRFGAIQANRRASLEVRNGEVHALVGETGAGKSTLMRILAGLYPPDGGEIVVNGRAVTGWSTAEAIDAGVGMVHQHFMLVPPLTVAENIVLGRELTRGPFVLDRARAEREVEELAKRTGLLVPAGRRVEELSVGEAQRVEILKTLYRGARILILDEPTAVLSPLEVEELSVHAGGAPPAGSPKPALELSEVSVRSTRGTIAVNAVSFSVAPGEILGIAGVEGNGQTELIEAIAGLRPTESGRITLGGAETVDLTRKTVEARTHAGLSHIPEDRHLRGLILEYSIADNLILGLHRQFTRNGLLDRDRIATNATSQVAAFDIRPPDPALPARALSGGNQQKIVIAREMGRDFTVLLAAQPTRGVDVGAIEFIHAQLRNARAAGKAVLLVSADLTEVLALSDRIAVMYGGRLVSVQSRAEASEESLGAFMTGAHQTSAA